MGIYFFMLLLSVTVAWVAQALKERTGAVLYPKKRSPYLSDTNGKLAILMVLSAMPFFLVAALRYKVGTDYNVYSNLQFPEVLHGLNDRVEWLYRVIIHVGVYMTMGESYQIIFVITHALIVGFFFAGIYRLSWDYRWSVMILFFSSMYNFSLNIMRQFIAMAIFVFAVRYILEKKFWRYMFWMAVAFLFHKTAVLFVPVYFLARITFHKGWLVGGLLACLLLKKYVFAVIEVLAPKLGYEKYLTNQFNNQLNQTVFMLISFGLLIVMLVGLANQKKVEDPVQKRYDAVLVNMQALTVLVCMWASAIPNSTRFFFLMAPTQITMLPRIFCRRDSRCQWLTTLLELATIGLYAILFLKVVVVRDFGETVPYMSIFGA